VELFSNHAVKAGKRVMNVGEWFSNGVSELDRQHQLATISPRARGPAWRRSAHRDRGRH
jgi:hypothetical protein